MRDRPEVSYTELDFEAATDPGLTRLVFVLDTESVGAGIPVGRLVDLEPGARQDPFRRRVPIDKAGRPPKQIDPEI